MENTTRTAQEPLCNPEDLIHSYTRADMLADDTLVDVSHLARDTKLAWPTALTQAVYETVRWTDGDNRRSRSLGQDEKGRLWDVLWMASLAVWGRIERAGRRFSPGESVRFLVTVRPRPGHGRKKLHAFRVIAGVGDDGGPVWTIATRDEDW